MVYHHFDTAELSLHIPNLILLMKVIHLLVLAPH